MLSSELKNKIDEIKDIDIFVQFISNIWVNLENDVNRAKILDYFCSTYSETPARNIERELFFAFAKEGEQAVMGLLLEKHGDTISNYYKGVALREASVRGHQSVVELLLEKYGTSIFDYDKGMALRAASVRGHQAMVELILEKCALSVIDRDVWLWFTQCSTVHFIK